MDNMGRKTDGVRAYSDVKIMHFSGTNASLVQYK